MSLKQSGLMRWGLWGAVLGGVIVFSGIGTLITSPLHVEMVTPDNNFSRAERKTPGSDNEKSPATLPQPLLFVGSGKYAHMPTEEGLAQAMTDLRAGGREYYSSPTPERNKVAAFTVFNGAPQRGADSNTFSDGVFWHLGRETAGRGQGSERVVSAAGELAKAGHANQSQRLNGSKTSDASASARAGTQSDFHIAEETDALLVSPSEGFHASGYAGGPFLPASKTYTLFNTAPGDLNWTAEASESWATVSSGGGMLDEGASTEITVGLDADSLLPGSYHAEVIFTNLDSEAAYVREVNLTVLPIPGIIGVTDSILPDDDLGMPFGEAVVLTSRTEKITVANLSTDHDLVVSGISRSGTTVFRLENLPAFPAVLGPLETFDFEVVYAPTSVGQHAALALISSTDADNPTVEVALSGVGISDPLVITPQTAMVTAGPAGGPFTPDAIVYTLTNNSAAALDWTVVKDPALTWAELSDVGGTLEADESNTLTLSVDPVVSGALPAGTHAGELTFTNLVTGRQHQRITQLEARPVYHFVWDAIPSPQYAGRPFAARLCAVDRMGELVTAYAGTATITGSPMFFKTVGIENVQRNIPLNTFYYKARTQVIYLQSEIGEAARITGLALDVTAAPGQMLGNWTIRMKHTEMSAHSPLAWEGPDSGWTTVHYADAVVDSTGWNWFYFTTPFLYDGESNLMIDYSFNNSSSSTSGFVRTTEAGQGRALYGTVHFDYSNPLDWTGTVFPTPSQSTRVPNIRLAIGDQVAVLPTTAGPFTDGVWTGDVSVMETADQMFLHAIDGYAFGISNRFDALDMLAVTPVDGLDFLGHVGGPFEPETGTYILTNRGGVTLNWTASPSEAWVTVTPLGGILEPDAHVEVTVSLNEAAAALAPGEHGAFAIITDTDVGMACSRPITVTAFPLSGTLAIEDSVPPTDDLALPFGEVFLTRSRTEQVFLPNADDEHPVVVNNISLIAAPLPSKGPQTVRKYPAVVIFHRRNRTLIPLVIPIRYWSVSNRTRRALRPMAPTNR